jgi:hypothetical protein
MNNPTQTPLVTDDNYVQENDGLLPQYEKGTRSKDEHLAYQIGHEGCDRYSGKSFDEAETELQNDYEQLAQESGISVPWQKARDAVHEAWDQAATT